VWVIIGEYGSLAKFDGEGLNLLFVSYLSPLFSVQFLYSATGTVMNKMSGSGLYSLSNNSWKRKAGRSGFPYLEILFGDCQ